LQNFGTTEAKNADRVCECAVHGLSIIPVCKTLS